MSGLREYQKLWLAIAASDADKPVTVSCHPAFVRRLVQAVRKEKSIANGIRKTLDMPRYGKMTETVIKVDKKTAKVTFILSYNGDKL